MQFIFAAHGPLAEEMKRTIELLLGEREDIKCFCMVKNKSGDDAEREIRALLDSCAVDELVVFTDLMGGSVNNIFTSLLMERGGFELVTGMNVALLLSVLTAYDGRGLGDYVEQGRGGVVRGDKVLEDGREENDRDISD